MGRERALDALARDLASGEVSRRSALKRLLAAGLGLGAAATPAGVAEALGGGCPSGRVKCKGKCCPKNARCKNGRCKCKAGFEKCGRKCVDTTSSLKHCGACGNSCEPGEVCLESDCVTQICTPGETQPCYSGPAGTQDVGICHGGTRTCNAQGTGFGPCDGEVTPQTEICGNSQDDDCDGVVDDGCCTPDPPATTCAGRECGTANNNCGQAVECGSCPVGEICDANGQCASSATCSDEIKNGNETDVDCGGPDCPKCANGKTCVLNTDCTGGNCCNGSCRNFLNDVNNCGACGATCNNPHGSTSCVSGTCSPTCDLGWANCDRVPSNGCETQVSNNDSACGSCFNACQPGTHCVGTQCVPI